MTTPEKLPFSEKVASTESAASDPQARRPMTPASTPNPGRLVPFDASNFKDSERKAFAEQVLTADAKTLEAWAVELLPILATSRAWQLPNLIEQEFGTSESDFRREEGRAATDFVLQILRSDWPIPPLNLLDSALARWIALFGFTWTPRGVEWTDVAKRFLLECRLPERDDLGNLLSEEKHGEIPPVDPLSQAIQVFQNPTPDLTWEQQHAAGLILANEIIRRDHLGKPSDDGATMGVQRVASPISTEETRRWDSPTSENEVMASATLPAVDDTVSPTTEPAPLSSLIKELSAISKDLVLIATCCDRINQLLAGIAERNFSNHSDLKKTVNSIQRIVNRGEYELVTARDVHKLIGDHALILAAETPVRVSFENPASSSEIGKVTVKPVEGGERGLSRATLIPLRLNPRTPSPA